MELIDKFVNTAYTNYRDKISSYINLLFDSNDHPNKDSLDHYCNEK
jgi:hypothetical protein